MKGINMNCQFILSVIYIVTGLHVGMVYGQDSSLSKADITFRSSPVALSNIKTVGSIRIIARDPIQFSKFLEERFGFKTWHMGSLQTGEEVVALLLKSGQSIEILSNQPTYATVPVDKARSVTLGVEVKNILATELALYHAKIPLLPVIPVHIDGDQKQPKMLELLFIASSDYPFNTIHFMERFDDEIAKIRVERPDFNDLPWRDQPNGVIAISDIWLAADSISDVEQSLSQLGLSNEGKMRRGLQTYRVNDVFLHIVSPEHEEMSKKIKKRLKSYGPGIFRIEFLVKEEGGEKRNLLLSESEENGMISLPRTDMEFVFVASDNKHVLD